jgi:regulatory protein
MPSLDTTGLDAKEARNRALSWLARREYGRQELIGKLVQRGCEEETAIRIVAALAAEGLVSDERFIEALLHVRRVRGYGPLYIRRELEEKGIARSTIERWLDVGSRDWVEDVKRVNKKKFGGKQPANLAERAKRTRFLQSRGFSHEQIRQALGSDDVDD